MRSKMTQNKCGISLVHSPPTYAAFAHQGLRIIYGDSPFSILLSTVYSCNYARSNPINQPTRRRRIVAHQGHWVNLENVWKQISDLVSTGSHVPVRLCSSLISWFKFKADGSAAIQFHKDVESRRAKPITGSHPHSKGHYNNWMNH